MAKDRKRLSELTFIEGRMKDIDWNKWVSIAVGLIMLYVVFNSIARS